MPDSDRTPDYDPYRGGARSTNWARNRRKGAWADPFFLAIPYLALIGLFVAIILMLTVGLE